MKGVRRTHIFHTLFSQNESGGWAGIYWSTPTAASPLLPRLIPHFILLEVQSEVSSTARVAAEVFWPPNLRSSISRPNHDFEDISPEQADQHFRALVLNHTYSQNDHTNR